MESVVNKIIEIDQLANERLSQSEEKRNAIIENAENECEELAEKLLAAANKRIQAVERYNKAEFDIKIAQLESQIEQECKDMDNVFKNIRESIEKSIFDKTVGD